MVVMVVEGEGGQRRGVRLGGGGNWLTKIFWGTVSEATGWSPEGLSLQQLHNSAQLTEGRQFQQPSPHLRSHGSIREACAKALKIYPQLLGTIQTVQQKKACILTQTDQVLRWYTVVVRARQSEELSHFLTSRFFHISVSVSCSSSISAATES